MAHVTQTLALHAPLSTAHLPLVISQPSHLPVPSPSLSIHPSPRAHHPLPPPHLLPSSSPTFSPSISLRPSSSSSPIGPVKRRLTFDSPSSSSSSPRISPFPHHPSSSRILALPSPPPIPHPSLPSTAISAASRFLHLMPHRSPSPSPSPVLPFPSPSPSPLPVLRPTLPLPPSSPTTSPSFLPLPSFPSAHSHPSPMRLPSHPACPSTPTRNLKRKRQEDVHLAPITLFQYRPRSTSAEDDELMLLQQLPHMGDMRHAVSGSSAGGDSVGGEEDSEGDEERVGGVGEEWGGGTEVSSVVSPASSPLPLRVEGGSLWAPDVRVSDFVLEEVIGRGSFSEVWRVRRRRRWRRRRESRGGWQGDRHLQGLLDFIKGKEVEEVEEQEGRMRDGEEGEEEEDEERFALIKSLQPVLGMKERQRVMRHGQLLSQLKLDPSAPLPPLPLSHLLLHSPLRPFSPSSSSPPSSPTLSWHPHLLRHYALWIEDSSVFRLTQLHPLGDLVSYFQQQPRPDVVVWTLLLHVGSALLHLSSLGLLHFDVKPSNILVSHPLSHPSTHLPPSFSLPSASLSSLPRFILADLGTMIALTDWPSAVDGEGDGQFLAPEVLGSAMLSSAVDVYALGCTAYACCTGRAVVRGAGGGRLKWEWVGEGVDGGSGLVGGVERVGRELRDVIARMTEVRVEERISLEEVVSRARARLEGQ